MPRLNLTDLGIRSLPVPDKGQRTFFDTVVKGFGVRVSQGGTKTFVLMHGKTRKLTTIGRVGIIKLSKAREKAKAILAEHTLGLATEKQGISSNSALDAFLSAYRVKNRERTVKETERLLRRHFPSHSDVSGLTTTAIMKVVDGIEAKSEAQHFFVAARTFCNWLVKRRYLQSSPLAGVDMPSKTQPRDRTLSDKELAAVWNACEGDYGDLVRLLMLTGQRVGQFTHLRGTYINRPQRIIEWPAEAMKGNRAHSIPYGFKAAEIINRRFAQGLIFTGADTEKPFSNFSNCQRRLVEKAEIPHWTLHDIRRSVCTQWAGPLRTPPYLCEVMLAHKGGEISGVHATYNRWTYQRELQQLAERWEERLASLLTPSIATVVPYVRKA